MAQAIAERDGIDTVDENLHTFEGDSMELEELEKQISIMETYLEEHGDEITQLYNSYEAEIEELIRQSLQITQIDPNKKSFLHNKENKEESSKSMIIGIGDVSEDRLMRIIARRDEIHTIVESQFTGRPLETNKGVCAFFCITNPILKSIINNYGKPLAKKGIETIAPYLRERIKKSDVFKKISQKIWDVLKKIAKIPDEELLNEELLSRQAIEKMEAELEETKAELKEMKIIIKEIMAFNPSPELKWLYFNADTFEEYYCVPLKEAHIAISVANYYYKVDNCYRRFAPNSKNDNDLYYWIIYFILRERGASIEDSLKFAKSISNVHSPKD